MPNESQPENSAPAAQATTSPRAGGVSRFPCGQCGAKLEFAPGTTTLKCPYCSHTNAIGGSDPAAVEELDFAHHLRALHAAAPMQDSPAITCTSCAATVSKPAHVDSLSCPYCGSNIVATAVSHRQIKPRAVLPFKVTRQEADGAFRKWLHGLWFAPSALKKQGKLDAAITGLYVPYWTYDCAATTPYRGERGEHYYVTVPYTTTVNGKPQMRTRQERRTRWYPASGTVFNTFDDLLVLASRSLPRAIADELQPWDLADLAPYDDAYLSGFVAENYQVDLGTGFGIAKEMTLPTIDQTIRGDIGGDEQRISQRDPVYSKITFKHLLLPVWISSYRYLNKVYRFYINARTGEVKGERPYSYWKIAFLVAAILAAIGIIALIASTR